MRSKFVIRLYWLGLAASIAILVVVALRTGLFGSAAKQLAAPMLDPAFAFYAENKDLVDKAVVAILSIGTAITGALGLLKSYYYADTNLPGRIQEMIEDARDRHAHDRREILAYVGGDFDPTDLLTPSLLSNPIAAGLKLIGYTSTRTRVRDAAADVPRLVGELKAIAVAQEHAENALVTGLIIRGACKLQEGDQLSANAVQRDNRYREALDEFEAAIKLRPADLDALEGAARTADRLNEQSKQAQYLEGIIEKARTLGETARSARASRNSALLLHKSMDADDQRLARERLANAAGLLNEADAEQRHELVETLLLLADIQANRGRTPTAKRLLARAKTLGSLDQQKRASGIATDHNVPLA